VAINSCNKKLEKIRTLVANKSEKNNKFAFLKISQ